MGHATALLRRRRFGIMLVGAVLLSVCAACSVGSSSADSRVAGPPGAVQDGSMPASNSRAAFPGAGNTGTSGDLSPYTGPLVITEPNSVIENVEIAAPGVGVAADNVTFRNVKFVYTGLRDERFAMVSIDPRVRGTLLENCEIDGRNNVARAVKGSAGVTVRSCDIHSTANGVEVGDDFTVERSYLHDIITPEGMGWHADGIQAKDEGFRNVRIVGNTVILTGRETAAVRVISRNGSGENVQIAGNLLGGGGYTVYVGAASSQNFVMANNAFTTEIFQNVGYFGTWYPGQSNVDVRGNFMLGSGAPSEPLPS